MRSVSDGARSPLGITQLYVSDEEIGSPTSRAPLGLMPAATPAPPAAPRGRWSWEDRRRVLTGTGAVVALLAAVALAVHRSRRRA